MKVKELIELLSKFDPELEVKVEYDGMDNELREDDVFIVEDKVPFVRIF